MRTDLTFLKHIIFRTQEWLCRPLPFAPARRELTVLILHQKWMRQSEQEMNSDSIGYLAHLQVEIIRGFRVRGKPQQSVWIRSRWRLFLGIEPNERALVIFACFRKYFNLCSASFSDDSVLPGLLDPLVLFVR